MKLDKRIKEGKRPLTCFDTVEAGRFICEKGYFSDDIKDFSNISNLRKEFLENISLDEDDYMPYKTRITVWEYFLPEKWVLPERKSVEKKYRAFTLAEWIEQHEIGEVIHYRNKSEGIEFRHMYMGYAFGKGKDITKINVGTVTLGVANYSFDYLFEDYEIEIDGEWLPFGVIDE